jgi:hypothetical protein
VHDQTVTLHPTSATSAHRDAPELRATIAIVHEAGPSEEFRVDPERLDSLAELFRSESSN